MVPLFMSLYVVGFVLWAFWLGGELRTREVGKGDSNAAAAERKLIRSAA